MPRVHSRPRLALFGGHVQYSQLHSRRVRKGCGDENESTPAKKDCLTGGGKGVQMASSAAHLGDLTGYRTGALN